MSEDLKIRLKAEEMTQYGYAALRQFPKAERFVMSADIRQSMYEIIRLIVITNKRYHKKTTLQDLDAELDFLRSLVRMAMQMKFLPFRQYEIWIRLINEIGRMLGGWIEHINKATKKNTAKQ